MNRSKPLRVSLVITTLNRPRLLRRLLQGVARQTLRPHETLVVDDGSPDPREVEGVLAPFRKKLPHLRLLRNDRNQGKSFSRNRGILEARHPLVALCDDDDEWRPNKLRLQVEAFRKDWGKMDLVYTWHLQRIEGRPEPLLFTPRHRGRALGPILDDCFLQPSSVLVRKDRLVEIGLFDEKVLYSEDWDLWIRFFQAGFSCEVLESPLTVYHLHAGSITYRHFTGPLRCLFKHLPLFLRRRPTAIPGHLLESLRRLMGILKRGLARRLGSQDRRGA